jgi:hypothetical protein
MSLGEGGTASPLRWYNGFFKNYLSVGNATGQASGWTTGQGNGIGLDVGTAGTNVAIQAYVNTSNSGILNFASGGVWSFQSGGSTHFSAGSSSVTVSPGGTTVGQFVTAWGLQLSKPLWFTDLGSNLLIGYQGGTGLGRPEITFTGGLAGNRTGHNANYTVVRSDCVVAVTDTTAARTITLPTSSTFCAAVSAGAVGKFLIIKDESGAAGTNHITITPNGTETIDGVNASVTISTNYGVVRLYADSNGHWFTF